MRWLVVTLLLGLALAGCGGGASDDAPRADAPTPVVVDTDMSTDDVLALLYLASSSDVDLRAVVVSGTGLTRCPAGAANAAALLAAAGRPEVPVACGRRRPRTGSNEYPGSWRARADALFGVGLARATRKPQNDGVGLLRREAARVPGTVVLSLGPMTDVAALLDEEGARDDVERIVAMAGALDVPGNVGGNEHAEYNLWVDPTAAAHVLGSGVDVTLVPLDATNDVPITVTFADVLERHADASASSAIAWDLFVRAELWRGGQYFWDPLAAASITEPTLLTYREELVDVVTSGREAGRLVRSGAGADVRIVTAAPRFRFEREFLKTVIGHGRFVGPSADDTTVAFDGRSCSYDGPAEVAAGDARVTTTNSSNVTFRLVVARLGGGHTADELAGILARADGPPVAPSWLTPEWTGDTPPQSEMTWVVDLSPPGSLVIGCTVGQDRAWVASPLRVTAPR